MIEPFANDSQSMQIGELVIENQLEKVIIYGDIDVYFNKEGYKQAKQLHELTGKIVEALEKDPERIKTSAESKDKNDQADENIDNPFL